MVKAPKAAPARPDGASAASCRDRPRLAGGAAGVSPRGRGRARAPRADRTAAQPLAAEQTIGAVWSPPAAPAPRAWRPPARPPRRARGERQRKEASPSFAARRRVPPRLRRSDSSVADGLSAATTLAPPAPPARTASASAAPRAVEQKTGGRTPRPIGAQAFALAVQVPRERVSRSAATTGASSRRAGAGARRAAGADVGQPPPTAPNGNSGASRPRAAGRAGRRHGRPSVLGEGRRIKGGDLRQPLDEARRRRAAPAAVSSPGGSCASRSSRRGNVRRGRLGCSGPASHAGAGEGGGEHRAAARGLTPAPGSDL